MIKQLKDGRFYVSVVCPDGVRRWRILRTLGGAHLFEAAGEDGWFNGMAAKSGENHNGNRLVWNLSRAWRRLVARIAHGLQS
ncbi:MAG: hypothetical protein Q7U39_17735 [Nitrospira sp.]|nr:hypothetical protein [Nitrospira sp.]